MCSATSPRYAQEYKYRGTYTLANELGFKNDDSPIVQSFLFYTMYIHLLAQVGIYSSQTLLISV